MPETQDLADTAREPRFAGVSREEVKKWYALMHLGRVLDDKAPNYLKQGLGWSYHAPCAGHDAIQLALGLTFRPGRDYLFPYYRDLMTCLAAGLTAEEILLNGMSKATDVASGGRHMSNHFAKPSIGIQNVSSCVSNHSQHAVGLARAVKTYRQDALVFCSVGESSLSEGYFSEAINGASREKLAGRLRRPGQRLRHLGPEERPDREPLRLGQLRAGTRTSRSSTATASTSSTRSARCARRSPTSARARDRDGARPVVRIHSHSNSDRQELYRTPEELAAARDADPLPRFRKLLLDTGLMNEEELRSIEAQNENAVRGGERPGPRARRSPTRPRSTSTSSPSPGRRSASPTDCPTAPARSRRSFRRSTRR